MTQEETGVAEEESPPASSDAAPASSGPREGADAEVQASAPVQPHDFLHDLPGAQASLPGPPLTRSPFLFGLAAAAGALLAWWSGRLLLSLGPILMLIVVAFFLAVGLNPLVEVLMRRGLQRAWSVLIVIIGVLAALTLFALAIAPIVTEQVNAMIDNAPTWLDQLQQNRRIQELDDKYDIIRRIRDFVTDPQLAQRVFGGVLGFGLALLSFLGNVFVVTVLTLYFLAGLPVTKRGLYRLAPASRRERVAFLGDRILRNIGGYVSGAFVVATAAGLSTLVFLFAVGLGEYAVALALVVAVLDVIPMIGATLGAVIVCAIGFATDVPTGLICVVFYIAYQQFENYLIYPRVMSRSVNIPGVMTVIAALVGASLLGVVGALLAIPTAAAILLLINEVYLPRQDAR